MSTPPLLPPPLPAAAPTRSPLKSPLSSPAGDRKPGPRKCTKWVKKKPTKCARKKFQGKCRESCDDYWRPESDIEFCTLPGAMSWPGSKKQLLAKMGGAPSRPKRPPGGSVDWTAGVPCVCTEYRDGATEEDAATTGLCQRTLRGRTSGRSR